MKNAPPNIQPYLYSLADKKEIKARIPRLSGIYMFYREDHRVVYVGKALNLKNRVNSYLGTDVQGKTAHLMEEATFVGWIPTDSELNALLLEAALIKKYQPKYNIIQKDDTHALYVKITIKEEFPKVLTSRREDDPKSLYFGPFPSAPTVKEVLRILRGVFPYCQQKRIGNRACFYTHLGLCSPCPSVISQKKGEERTMLKHRYRLQINHLIKVLEGSYEQVLIALTTQMRKFSDAERYEEAAVVRERIKKLEYITSSHYKIASFLSNPTFLADMRSLQLKNLIGILKPFYPKLTTLSRIECFDISNLFGTFAVGSMVVLTKGIEDKSQYRRFRIRTVSGISDVAMMREVLSRRRKHFEEWREPDLIVVDGGKTQVAAALSVLKSKDLNIPLIGLAKRLEQIIVPLPTDPLTYKVITLKLTQPGISILRTIRDEAHRFALTYHKKLRSKGFLIAKK